MRGKIGDNAFSLGYKMKIVDKGIVSIYLTMVCFFIVCNVRSKDNDVNKISIENIPRIMREIQKENSTLYIEEDCFCVSIRS